MSDEPKLKLGEDGLDWAAQQEPPKEPPPPAKPGEWFPQLNPTQKLAFDSSAESVLMYGPKGSGKTIGGLHALVRHCYFEKDALALIIGKTIYVGKEGALYDLVNLVLPTWRDGNRYPEFLNGKPHPKAGKLMDHGMGLKYTEPKQDPDTKDRVLFIGNRHGGWSKVILKAIPYEEAVDGRMRGPAPSFIQIEEITTMGGPEYYVRPMMQMGRRRDIKGPMQLYASCNPDGPSHWVYKIWFVDCIDPDTKKRNPNFAVFHIAVAENLHRLPAGYVQRLKDVLRDPIERRRLIGGEWVDRPSGDAIFKTSWLPEIHVKGDAAKGDWDWTPFPNLPVVIGIDPGPANYSIHFLQRIVTAEKTIWVVFDEINLVGEHKTNLQAAKLIVRRMDQWDGAAGKKLNYIGVADEAAFTQRNTDGSYDGAQLQLHSGGRLRLRGCPKGAGSIRSRVQMVMDKLLQEELFISARCVKTIDMFGNLTSAKQKQGEYSANVGYEPVKSPYTHPFSSMSYGMFYFELLPSGIEDARDDEARVPRVYAMGSAS